jgi:hypothetical protein
MHLSSGSLSGHFQFRSTSFSDYPAAIEHELHQSYRFGEIAEEQVEAANSKASLSL